MHSKEKNIFIENKTEEDYEKIMLENIQEDINNQNKIIENPLYHMYIININKNKYLNN